MQLEELQGHLQSQGLAKYKWPEFLELVDEIPVSGPGKVDRRLLKKRAASEEV
jgi:non-ribosomal peptide synthetase component E (peptide arylation enzyme)